MPQEYESLWNRIRECALDIEDLEDNIWRNIPGRIHHPVIGHIHLAMKRCVQVEVLLRRIDLDYARLRKNSESDKPDQALEAILLVGTTLDVESLYIFSNLLLDVWSKIVAYALRLKDPEDYNFAKLYFSVHRKGNIGRLNWLRQRCGRHITESYLSVRLYRNDKIEHAKGIWSQTLCIDPGKHKFIITHDISADDVDLDEYADLLWEPVNILKELSTSLQSTIMEELPAITLNSGGYPLEADNPTAVMSLLLSHLHDIDDPLIRKRITELYKKFGGSANYVDLDMDRLISILEMTIPNVHEELASL